MKILPTAPEIAREALIVVGGAIVAAIIVGQMPALRDWIKRQWADTPNPLQPWQ